MRIDRRTCLLGAVAIGVVGCASAPRRRIYPEISFSGSAPLRLNVAEIKIVAGYVSPEREPFVDHLFPEVPADVAMRWGRQRLRAIGATGEAIFTVTDASAVLAPLPTTEGLAGILTDDQAERCDLRIEMSLRAFRPLPVASGEASGHVTRSHTLAEGMNAEERSAAWFEMTEQAMRELDRTFAATILARMGHFVVV